MVRGKKVLNVLYSPRAKFDSMFSELIRVCGQWQPGRRKIAMVRSSI